MSGGKAAAQKPSQKPLGFWPGWLLPWPSLRSSLSTQNGNGCPWIITRLTTNERGERAFVERRCSPLRCARGPVATRLTTKACREGALVPATLRRAGSARTVWQRTCVAAQEAPPNRRGPPAPRTHSHRANQRARRGENGIPSRRSTCAHGFCRNDPRGTAWLAVNDPRQPSLPGSITTIYGGPLGWRGNCPANRR
jgi:hypothetical protein